MKIKFVYRTGVHLKGMENGMTTKTDDDGNELILWNGFEWDENDKIGTKYEETYNYEHGSDLFKLVSGTIIIDEEHNIAGNFYEYINGVYDLSLPTYKFEFTTINNTFNYEKTIANQNVNIVSLLTDYEIYRNDFNEFAGYELFREDFYNGITYKPTRDIDVHIERGSTSVFDKHISLGWIKTLDDMIDYQNHSFFKMNNG